MSLSKSSLAALVGGLYRLAIEPQVVAGAALVASGIWLKLSWSTLLLLHALCATAAVAAVAILDFKPLSRLLPATVMDAAARHHDVVVAAFSEVPLWLVVVLGFSALALGELFASYEVVSGLSAHGVNGSVGWMALNGLISTAASAAAFVFFRFAPAWLRPHKIAFVVQTVWVIGSTFFHALQTADAAERRRPPWASMLIGWGSLLLSSIPDAVVVQAADSAILSASALPAVDSVVDGLRWYAQTTREGFDDKVGEVAQSAAQQRPQVLERLIRSLDVPVPVAAAVALLRTLPTCLVFALVETEAVASMLWLGPRAALVRMARPLLMLPFCASEAAIARLQAANVKADGASDGMSVLLRSTSLSQAWTCVFPPLQVRLWMHSPPKMCVRTTRVGSQLKQDDADAAAVSAHNADVLRTLWAPHRILLADEDAVRNAPPLDARVVKSLVFSVAVDLLGSGSRLLPWWGELLDIVWAPVSAFSVVRARPRRRANEHAYALRTHSTNYSGAPCGPCSTSSRRRCRSQTGSPPPVRCCFLRRAAARWEDSPRATDSAAVAVRARQARARVDCAAPTRRRPWRRQGRVTVYTHKHTC